MDGRLGARRRRAPGHDWCLVKLGIQGTIRAVTVDTDHFLGNHPPFASLDACHAPSASAEQLRDAVEWTTVVSGVGVHPVQKNLAAVADDTVWTHVRLRIYPAGGVARLRIWGEAAPPVTTGDVDLAALAQGGLALAAATCSSLHEQPAPTPTRRTYGTGLETRRSRPPGEDWVIIKLGQAGRLKRAPGRHCFLQRQLPRPLRFCRESNGRRPRPHLDSTP